MNIKYIRLERDCGHNDDVRAGNKGVLLIDYMVEIDGKPVAEFHRRLYRKGYDLYDNGRVQCRNEHRTPYVAETKADFYNVFTLAAGLGHLPNEQEIAARNSAIKAQAERVEAEALELKRIQLINNNGVDLLSALSGLLKRYTSLVNSGDAGFWNPETEDEVIAARAVIAKAEGTHE